MTTTSDFPEVQQLREQVRNRRLSVSNRCAAVYRLAKIIGPDASGDLKACLRGNREVRVQAMMGLAAYGTDIAWDDVFTDLGRALKAQTPTDPGLPFATLVLQSTIAPMACYLGRHLDVPGRHERVSELVEANWSHLYSAEQRWFTEFWPPTGPDPHTLSEWIRVPWFAESGI